MNRTNLQIIRESFGRVVYAHKTHEKDAEISSRCRSRVKWINIILTTLTSGALIKIIITNQMTFIYLSASLSAITLAFIIFQLSFNPEERAERHRQSAKELWYIREKYVNLMADIVDERINDDTVTTRRNEIIEELKLIYKFAPTTSSKAYKKAQKALKINEELTFTNDEIDQFLPDELKFKKVENHCI